MSTNKKKNHISNSRHKINLNKEIKVPPHHHDIDEKDVKHSHNNSHSHASENNTNSASKRNLIIVVCIILVVALIGYAGYIKNGKTALALVTEESDTVSVLYTGRLDTGEVFDTNIKEIAMSSNITRQSFDPLQFRVGSGQMIKGFDLGVVGMKIGEKKNISISPESAYGIYKSELVETIPKANFTAAFPDVINLTNGMRLSFYYQGRPMSLEVKSFDKQYVTVDLNHPLAGKILYFEVMVVNITKPSVK